MLRSICVTERGGRFFISHSFVDDATGKIEYHPNGPECVTKREVILEAILSIHPGWIVRDHSHGGKGFTIYNPAAIGATSRSFEV